MYHLYGQFIWFDSKQTLRITTIDKGFAFLGVLLDCKKKFTRISSLFEFDYQVVDIKIRRGLSVVP